MSKYAEMSDTEINKLVANKQHDYSIYNKPDYCNNPEDAWPIILEAEISLIRDVSTNDVWEAVPKGWYTENGFISNVNGDLCFIDKNPLRAAMIVYLMMEDEA